VKEFGLIKHYDIKETEQYKYYKLCEEYEAHFSFTRTRYGSIQIDVLDEDASKAAAMANKIVYLIDTVKNEMIKARTVPAYEINRREKEIIEQDIKIILDRLDTLSKIGVVTAEARGRLFQAYNEAKGKEDRRYFRKQIEVIKLLATYRLDSYRENAQWDSRRSFSKSLATKEINNLQRTLRISELEEQTEFILNELGQLVFDNLYSTYLTNNDLISGSRYSMRGMSLRDSPEAHASNITTKQFLAALERALLKAARLDEPDTFEALPKFAELPRKFFW